VVVARLRRRRADGRSVPEGLDRARPTAPQPTRSRRELRHPNDSREGHRVFRRTCSAFRKIVAQLSFGFWRHMTSRGRGHEVWVRTCGMRSTPAQAVMTSRRRPECRRCSRHARESRARGHRPGAGVGRNPFYDGRLDAVFSQASLERATSAARATPPTRSGGSSVAACGDGAVAVVGDGEDDARHPDS
jgi:hypothetical protein